MTHTPGPWQLGARDEQILYRADGGAWQFIADTHGVGEDATANARLIAAAPELLEALDNAHGILQVNLGDVDPHVRAACDLMWSAITKARGES